VWQSTLIGRAEIWPVHQKTADLGGMLRTGLEDTFYLPGGERASGNGVLIEALAPARANAGRESPRRPRPGPAGPAAAACMLPPAGLPTWPDQPPCPAPSPAAPSRTGATRRRADRAL
jgi:hypothetical protein